MQCELEEQAVKGHKVQAQVEKAEHLLSEKDTEGAIGKAAAEAAARDISALRGELKAHADAAAKVRNPRVSICVYLASDGQVFV